MGLTKDYRNRLADQSSLYLRQHAHQPVDWYPWGPAAFEKARAEDKPILLSIGYSACHWCHVMAHESFDDPETARLMNELYVSIKVDREERPDLDEVYMAAVQALTGQGGWPMTVFLTPEGRPFYAGTYFPPQDRHGLPGFRRLLVYLAQQYRARRPDIERIGDELAQAVRTMTQAQWKEGELRPALLDNAVAQLLDAYDEQNGGFGGAPKFPQPMALQLLLRVGRGSAAAERAVRHTLDQMAAGGMYDLVGGGFHRYSVDERWLIPHFEKMLYDNALLVLAYLDGYVVFGDERYRRVVEQTCDYLLREMRLDGGVFAAAQDADTMEGEGRYFSWRWDEFREVVGVSDAGWATAFFGVTEAGNFEHGLNVLRQSMSVEDLARQLRVGSDDAWARVDTVRERLREQRERRPRPARDEKALADWNGLAIRALAHAGRVLGRADYLAAASAAADFILKNMLVSGRLCHAYADGRALSEGFLDDYAHLASGLIALHQTTHQERWLHGAAQLIDVAIQLFWDTQGATFFFTPQDHVVPLTRPMRYVDMPTPSGNSMMTYNLLLLDALLGRPAWRELAEQSLKRFARPMESNALALAQMLMALDVHVYGVELITLVGERDDPALEEMAQIASRGFAPRRLSRQIMVGAEEYAAIGGRATAYVCRGRTCLPPLTSPDALSASLAG